MASSAGFGQVAHHDAVIVGARSDLQELLEQRMGGVGQFEQPQRSGEIENTLQQKQQQDGQDAHQEAVSESPHRGAQSLPQAGLGEDLDGEDGIRRREHRHESSPQQSRALGDLGHKVQRQSADQQSRQRVAHVEIGEQPDVERGQHHHQ